MSITHGSRKTPWVALLVGSAVGYAVLLLLHAVDPTGSGAFGGVILNMAVFGALIAYVMQMIAFIVLRRRFPEIERPYRSPLGTPGAWVALAISLAALVLLFGNPDFRPGVIGVAVWFLAGLLYFALVGRHRLVLSPEEEFALTRGEHDLPQEERDGHTKVSDPR
jgi:ethanolamine permease